MKKSLIALFALVFVGLGVYAQSPSKFNYQAIARDADGLLIENSSVGVRISILQGSSSGSEVYSEEHSPTTNDFGLFNLQIGTGSNVSGDLGTIDWGADSYYIMVEFDEDGGSNYSIMSTSELVSVPYALMARSVENDSVIDDDADAMNEIQTLSWSNDSLMLTDGGSVDLSGYDQSADVAQNAADIAAHNAADMDTDSTNELITDFVWDGDSTLTITEAGADWDVDLSSLIDDDDWVRANDSTIYNTADKVGVGTDDPVGTLHVDGDAVDPYNEGGALIVGDAAGSNLAIDGNDIQAKYEGDSADRLWLQRRGQFSVGSWYNNAYKGLISTDSNDYTEGWGGIQIYRHHPKGNSAWSALVNYNNSQSGAANTFGTINYNLYSDSNDYGTYNFNYANGYGNSYGNFNELMYSADTAFGTYNLISNPNTSSYGVYNKVKSSNYYGHYGSYTKIDSTYYSYGSYNDIDYGYYQYGNYNRMDYAQAYAYGDYNYLYYPRYGYGNYTQIYYPTYTGYGSYNLVQASNGYTQYGNYSSAYNYNTGSAYGAYNYGYASSNWGYGAYNYGRGRYAYGSYNRIYYPTYYGYGSYSQAQASNGYTQYAAYNQAYNYGGAAYAQYNYAYTSANSTAMGSYNYAYGGGTYDYAYGLYGYAYAGYYQNWAGYFSGVTYSSGGYSSSDAKLKTNIRDLDDGIDAIMQLKPRRYSFDTEAYPTMGLPEDEQIGVIAQELEEVFPELVKSAMNQKVRMPESHARESGFDYEIVQEAIYDEEGELIQEAEVEAGEIVEFKAVRYESLIPVLIKATQEQQEIIESLRSTIDELNDRIESLESN